LASAALAACTGAPPLEDPREIMTRSVEAMTALSSAHVDVTLDGTIAVSELGGEFSLNGTTFNGDFDLESASGTFTFAVPAFLGLTGDLLFTPHTAFVRTSMTGEQWMSQPLASSEPMAAAGDPDKALADLNAFLDTEGVAFQKLPDAECADTTCYHVEVTVPAEVLAAHEQASQVDPAVLQALGDGLVFDLQFDKSTLYMTRMSTSFASADMGSIDVVVSLSGFNQPVDVDPPPSDQVTEGFTLP
jgi:hypothetical protein